MLCFPVFEAKYITVIGLVWEQCVGWRGIVKLCFNLNPQWHSTLLLTIFPTKSPYTLLKTPQIGSLESFMYQMWQNKIVKSRVKGNVRVYFFISTLFVSHATVTVFLHWIYVFPDKFKKKGQTYFQLLKTR